MLRIDRGRWVLVCAAVLVVSTLSACNANPKNKPNTVAEPQQQTEVKAKVEPDPVGADAHYARAVELLKSDSKNPAAQRWLESAAMQGHGDAAYQLGQLQDEPSSQVEWYSMAASVGQVDAQYALGDAYLNGRGTAKEPAWGLSWLERAARAGHARAQFAIGLAMATGLTGAPQRSEALVWLLIAQKNGFAYADAAISSLKARLTQTAIEQTVERANAWTNEPAGDAENRAFVRFAQYALGRMGFDAGLADGIIGDRTKIAVQAFRKAQGLGDGAIDGHMLDILRERLAVFNR